MSDQPTTPVEVATGVDANAAATNAAQDVDAHTPSTDHVAPAPEMKTDATDNESGIGELKEIVAGLATSVATLTTLVTKETDPDTPAQEKVPWLFKGSKKKWDDD